MADKINDGGPAFPVGDQSTHPLMIGMSIRDWFAGQALAGFRACETDPELTTLGPKRVAELAYDDADAMLSEKGKRNG